MYFNFTIPVPVGPKFVTQEKKSGTYVDYEYAREYDAVKKYTVPKRSTIGKIYDKDPSRMYPNDNYLKFFSDAAFPEPYHQNRRSSCLRAGAYMVIRRVFDDSGIPEILSDHFSEKDAGLLMDFAAYSIVSENNSGQYYPDYAYNHPLFTKDMKIYTDSKISSFLQEITADQRIGFLNDWNAQRDHREKVYISYDATNKNCQAGEIDFAEFGYAKDDPSKPIVNYAIAYDTENREPLFYDEYPGSINDSSQLKYMVEKTQAYGYKRIGFILDRGYFSKANLDYIDECGYSFVIMVKGMKALVKDLILKEKGTFEKKRSSYIKEYGVSGTTIKRKMFESDEKERYFHVYYSLGRENKERAELEEKLRKMSKTLKKEEGKPRKWPESYGKYFDLYYQEKKETYKGTESGEEREITKETIFLFGREKEDVVEAEINLQGYFAIVTSDKMTAAEAMELYGSRDVSEKLFRADKSFLDDAAFRVQTNEAMDSKIFIAFIGLIIRNRIFTALKDEMKSLGEKYNFMTVPAAIRELEKIELVKHTDNYYRLDHAVTKKQKMILKAFGMNEDLVDYYAGKIREELQRIMKGQ